MHRWHETPALVFRPLGVGGQDRAAAGVAELVRSLGESVADRDPPVEDEAVAAPGAALGRGLAQISQYAAAEMQNLLGPEAEQMAGGLLAADSASAEHGDALAREALLAALPPCRKVAKRRDSRIHRAREAADGDLVVVAHVDDGDVGRGEQIVPLLGIDAPPDPLEGIGAGFPHGDDLALEADFEAAKGRLRGETLAVLEIGAARQAADMRQRPLDRLAGSGDGAVDPLARQQQGSRDAGSAARREQRTAQRGRVVEAGEPVEGGDHVHGGGLIGGWRRGGNCARVSGCASEGSPG